MTRKPIWGTKLVLSSVLVLALIGLIQCPVGISTPALARQDVQPLGPRDPDDTGILKWVTPVRISLAGETAEQHRDTVEVQAALIRKITKHQIEVVESDEGDLVLLFATGLPDSALADHARILEPLYVDKAAMVADLQDDGDPELCIAKRGVSPENSYAVVYAVGLVPADLNGDDTKACITRQLISAMAFSVAKGRPLVKDGSKDRNAGLGNFLQVVMLQAIYDNRVKPGMPAAGAQPIISEYTMKAMKALK